MTEIQISDSNLFNALVKLNWATANKQRSVSLKKIKSIKSLQLKKVGISSFPELKYFTNLTKLDLSNNEGIKELQLTENTKLRNLILDNNKISCIDITPLKSLKYFSAQNNLLKNLELPESNCLFEINVSKNKLESIDISKCKRIKAIQINDNLLKHLDISNTKLYFLNCSNNHISELNLFNQVQLELLNIYNNDLKKVLLPKRKIQKICFLKNSIIENDILNWIGKSDVEILKEEKLKAYETFDSYYISLLKENNTSNDWTMLMFSIHAYLEVYDKINKYHRKEKDYFVIDEFILLQFNFVLNYTLEIQSKTLSLTRDGKSFFEEISRFNTMIGNFTNNIKIIYDSGFEEYKLNEGFFHDTIIASLELVYYEYEKITNNIEGSPEKFVMIND
jgi:hypothetical protein